MNKVIKNAKNGRIVAALTTEDGYIRRYISHALYINRTFCMEDGDASGLPKMAEFAAFWAGHPKLIGYFIGGLSDAGLLVKVINDAYAAEYHMACMPFGYCEKDQKGAVRPLKPSLVYVAPYYMDGRVIVKKEPGYAVGYGRVEFFSGQLMQGESAAEAAMRILKEETGLDTANPLAMPCGFIDTDLPGSDAAVVSLEVSEKIDCARIRENSTICMTEPEELLKRVADGAECGSILQCFLLGYHVREEKAKKEEEARDIFDEIAGDLRDYPEGEIWSIGNEILCKTKSAADAIADMLETLYRIKKREDVQVYTGYYDPVEDERNGEEDWCTGWWYVNIG